MLVDLNFNMPRFHRFIIIALVLKASCIQGQSKLEQNQKLREHQYQVHFDNHLRTASVEICFAGSPPEYLAVDYKRSNRNLIDLPKSRAGRIEILGRYWKTANLRMNSCINYAVDISEHLTQVKQSDSPLISFQRDNTWLWLPEKLGEDESVVIHFQVPSNFELSVPWQKVNKQEHRYRISRAPIDWGFTLIAGNFRKSQINMSEEKTIELAFLGDVKQVEALTHWISNTAQSLASYMGKFPVAKTQVVLIESQRPTRGPVPWGEVNRGGGFGLRFVIDSNKSIESFHTDWTASHEFSHLLFPKVSYQDLWLSEGLASYLQYLLMAREGSISKQSAWQSLYEGLERGRRGALNLGKETFAETLNNRRKSSWRSGRTMRIYWSGAAMFLKIDWMLLKQSDGQVGLNTVLRRFNECCSDNAKAWQGAALMQKFDELAGTKLFEPLYLQTLNNSSFPDFIEPLAGLGIDIEDGRVTLKPDSLASFRGQIDSAN